MKINIFFLILFASFNLNTISAVSQTPTVRTKYGLVSGIKKSNLLIFKGIPFAAPPIGDLRWKAPENPTPWNGIKKCDKFSASPIQNKPQPFYCWSEEFIAPPEPLSEDCLYLNIWTAAQKDKRKLPVFVWIYGGGFNSGSAACKIYDGESYAKNGILFVSINYRVGPFGFMSHPELSAEQNNASGNYGIMDQIQALKWINENIAYFGGDPKNVTIAGQSAGSMSVNSLIASPLAKGLFQKAITQSGGILNNRLASDLQQSEKLGIELQDSLKVASLSEMRKLSAPEILSMSNKLKSGRFSLTLDNYVLPADIDSYFKNGLQNHVPMISGWVAGDGSLIQNGAKKSSDFKKDIESKYGNKAAEFLNVFTSENDDEALNSQKKISLFGFAAMPSHLLACYNQSKTYVYEINHVPSDKANFPNYGAFHTSEVPYVLGNLSKWNRIWQKHDLDTQKTLTSYWLNFIKTGNPNAKDLVLWEAHTKENTNILKVDNKSELIPNMYQKEFELLSEN